MRIGIVNDLPIAVESLCHVLRQPARHEVAWIARDGREAVSMCAASKPELILMDLDMPGMDGVAATRQIMKATPCPILVVTASVGSSSARVFEALGAGAMDAVNTPVIGATDAAYGPAAFLQKLDMIRRLTESVRREPAANSVASAVALARRASERLIVIGSSAGGPTALAAILNRLPPALPAAIVIVQHLDENFAPGFADWLNRTSAFPVRLAQEGDRPMKGAVLVAGKSDHLVFVNRDTLGYVSEPRDCLYRPSVDVFFDSVVRHWDGEVVGVLLTGMGRDGARGLKALRDAGHFTLAQDQATSAVYGMPKAAASLDAASLILALGKIAPTLSSQFKAA